MFSLFKKKVDHQTGAEMAEEGLKQISLAVKNGTISLEKGRISNDIYVHADHPNGTPRISYIIRSPAETGKVIARCVVLMDRAIGTVPVWQIDWAVDRNYRGKGLGRRIAEMAVAEFCSGMKGKFKEGFMIEAVVDHDNSASNKIAERLIGNVKTVKDKCRGIASNNYIRHYKI